MDNISNKLLHIVSDLCITRDAITSLQSLVSLTFDNNNLEVTVCISFSYIIEDTLKQVREKHKPDIIAAVEERKKGDAISLGY